MTEPPMSRLGDVASFVRGITFKPDDVVPVGTTGSVACMRTKNVQSELDLSDVWGIPEEFVKRDDQNLRPGDLLVSSANSWNLVGKCCRVPELPWRSTFGGFISVLRGDMSRIEPRYLYHWFSSSRIQATVRSFGQKTTNISNLNIERCLNLPLPLPPLPEQRRIAEILDKADALRAKRRAVLAQLDTLTQSIFLDMFGDPATNPKEWPRLQLGDLSDKVKTWNPTSKPQDEFIYIDIAAIDQVRKRITGARRILGTDAPSRARQQVCTGDVLISTVRPNLNAVATIDDHLDGATASTGFCVLRPRETRINSAYLFALVRHDAFIGAMVRQASGASYPAVTDAIVRAWLAPCPPIELQREYARRMKGLARVQARGEASLDEFEGLFASLQHRAFRGEL